MVLLQDQSKFSYSWVVCLSLILENMTILSFVILLSTFVRPVIAMLGGFSIFLIGHWLPDMKYFAMKAQNEGLQMISEGLMWVVPQFFQFNWKTYFFFQDKFEYSELRLMTLHCFSWMAIALMLSVLVFRRKDIV